MSILERVHCPEDLQSLNPGELHRLAEEIRRLIIDTVAKNGGHLASNLGVVELTIALHRVFSSPRDRIVWDVGHQSYAHKILTGRRDLFHTLRKKDGLSGFPKRCESPHDFIETGHSSTSISAALGMLEAMRRTGKKGKVIAVIGDGAMTGGEAYEGLSHAGQLGRDLVIVLNDNKMSIGPNVGALSRYLSRLTAGRRYQLFRREFDGLVGRIPGAGPAINAAIAKMKKGVKAIFFKESLFSDLGFEYVGPIDGHSLPSLADALSRAKNLSRPVVVHVTTRKGAGYEFAETDPSRFHGIQPFSVSDGKSASRKADSYTEAFAEALVEVAQKDPTVVAITAAMAKGTGLDAFQRAFPPRFYDVGIAEQHAVTFASGLATEGLRPVVALYSTFAQRAFDQIVHDVALPGLPVTFALDRAGPVPDDGETHQGLYDIPMILPLPHMSLVAPATASEMRSMLAWASLSGKPCAIRYPKAALPEDRAETEAPLVPGRGVFLGERGGEVLIATMGGLLPEALKARELLAGRGIRADVYNLRFLKPFDAEYFGSIVGDYRDTLILEEGTLTGGFAEHAMATIQNPARRSRVFAAGALDRPYPHMSREQLLDCMGLSARAMADAIALRNR